MGYKHEPEVLQKQSQARPEARAGTTPEACKRCSDKAFGQRRCGSDHPVLLEFLSADRCGEGGYSKGQSRKDKQEEEGRERRCRAEGRGGGGGYKHEPEVSQKQSQARPEARAGTTPEACTKCSKAFGQRRCGSDHPVLLERLSS